MYHNFIFTQYDFALHLFNTLKHFWLMIGQKCFKMLILFSSGPCGSKILCHLSLENSFGDFNVDKMFKKNFINSEKHKEFYNMFISLLEKNRNNFIQFLMDILISKF